MSSVAAARQSTDDMERTSRSDAQMRLSGATFLLIAVCLYLAAQWLAFHLTIKPDNISVYWPPAGVMFAAFVLSGPRQWRLLIPAIFASTLVANWLVGRGLQLNLALSAIDVFVGGLGAHVYTRLAGHQRPLCNVPALLHFAVCTLLSSVLSAALGVMALRMFAGYEFDVLNVWTVWCGAMLTGLLLVSPLLMELADFDRAEILPEHRTEFVIIMLIAAALLFVGYGWQSINYHTGLAAAILLIPLLIWTAMRCSAGQTALLLFMITTIEIYCVARGLGTGRLLPVPAARHVEWVEAIATLRGFTVFLIAANTYRIRQLETASRIQAERLSSIIDTATDGIISINETGTVLSFSKAAEKHFGYSAEDVIGHNIKMLMAQYHRERHDNYLQNYARTGHRRIIGIGRLVSAQRKDGSVFPMELSVGEAKVGNARVFTGFVRDVSERQETEQRLHELQDELFHVSRLSALGELASALAHELNQPLTAIKNYAQAGNIIIKKGGRQSELPSILDKTIEQAGRAGEIIKRLRAYVTAKKIESEPEDIHEIIEEACALALVGAKEDGIRTTVTRNQDIPPVVVDRIQIQQVLINLIRNAIDAMRGAAHRDLVIEALLVDGMVQVRVADTGAGVSTAALPDLFKPFVTTKETGMGVGLSISRTIAEAHGGRLHYEANPSGGAIFVLTLPVGGADVDKSK